MPDINDLSKREREILCLVTQGASNKQIAQKLYISTNTVKVHVRNIFSKIGVASRTEAAMFAVSAGLVEPVETPDQVGFEVQITNSDGKRDPHELDQPGIDLNRWLLVAAVFGLVVIVIGGLFLVRELNDNTLASSSPPESATTTRWQEKAEMPTAREALGVATNANQIFAIAGETEDGVTNVLEGYDPALDQWISLASKSVGVADILASTVGGQIYIPGGRLDSGEITDVLEVYDPVENMWYTRSPMPVSLSAYTLVAFEGNLYLFGGWDGEKYVNSAYKYDPNLDEWSQQPPMKTARGYAGGAVAGGKIYVIGGVNSEGALDVNEVYQPSQEGEVDGPWSTASPIPESRYAMGVASVADIIHIIGGIGEVDVDLYSLVYFPNSDKWQKFTSPYSGSWSNLGLVPLESQLYALGGLLEDTITDQNMAYQAIFTVLFPVVK